MRPTDGLWERHLATRQADTAPGPAEVVDPDGPQVGVDVPGKEDSLLVVVTELVPHLVGVLPLVVAEHLHDHSGGAGRKTSGNASAGVIPAPARRPALIYETSGPRTAAGRPDGKARR
jgi:hypothetical protein